MQKAITISLILFVHTAVVTCLTGQSFTNIQPMQDIGTERVITAIAVDKENNKYIGTDSALLRISHDGIVETLFTGTRIHAIAWHHAQGLWSGIQGNTLLQPGTGERILLEGENLLITSMAFSGGRLWVGTNQGLFVVSLNRQEVTEHFTPKNSKLDSEVINYVYVDESRIKWIGTESGVVRIEGDRWKLYEKGTRITAITGNREGVWIAGPDEMWLVDPFNRWAPTNVDRDLSAGDVRALAADQKGNIYILSEIFTQFDPYTNEVVEIENNFNIKAEGHVALLCDMNDKIWLSTLNQGLLAMDMQPAADRPLEAFAVVKHPTCAGDRNGSLSISAQGGAPPYSYAWESEEMNGRNPDNLGPGNYSVTVTDAAGSEYPLFVELEEPQPFAASVEVLREVSAEGASDAVARVNFTGGEGDLTYQWSNGASSRTAENLSSGHHGLTVTDMNGCRALAEIVIEDGPPVAIAPEGREPEQNTETLPAKKAEVITSVDVTSIKRLRPENLGVGQTLRIEQLYFKADSTNIEPESYPVLDEIYAFLKSNDRIIIEIGGHTNSLPEHDYCDRLSAARAKSVADYLYQKGIPEARITYKGYGKRNPIATNETVAGRRQNQRVEIKILQI